MKVSLRRLTLPVAAAGAAASVILAPAAYAGPDEVCRDAGSAVCHRSGQPSSAPGAMDPATQQLLGGNLPNPVLPGVAAFG
ncbi:MAG: hypothetical protein U0Q47_07170 [Mycobacterium sp.]